MATEKGEVGVGVERGKAGEGTMVILKTDAKDTKRQKKTIAK